MCTDKCTHPLLWRKTNAHEKIFQFGSLSLATLPDISLKQGRSDSVWFLHYPHSCDAWVFALHIPRNSLKTKMTADVPLISGFPFFETNGVKTLLQEVSVLFCLISFDLIPDSLLLSTWEANKLSVQRRQSKRICVRRGKPSNPWREVLPLLCQRKADTLQLPLGLREVRSDMIRKLWLRQTLPFPKGEIPLVRYTVLQTSLSPKFQDVLRSKGRQKRLRLLKSVWQDRISPRKEAIPGNHWLSIY